MEWGSYSYAHLKVTLDDWNEVLMEELLIINIGIHSCFMFPNCVHYLILFFPSQIETSSIYRHGCRSGA